MSFQEKSAITSLIANVIGCTLYFSEVFRRFSERDASAGGEFAFWGAAILIFIPVVTVIKVIVQVIFVIINTVTQGEEEPAVTDELDHLIELKAVRNFCLVFMAGFLLAMGAVAAANLPTLMFVALFFTMMISGAVLDLSKFYYYRRGV